MFPYPTRRWLGQSSKRRSGGSSSIKQKSRSKGKPSSNAFPPNLHSAKLPRPKPDNTVVPPAFLVPTGSPHVFISALTATAMNPMTATGTEKDEVEDAVGNDAEPSEPQWDAQELFRDMAGAPLPTKSLIFHRIDQFRGAPHPPEDDFTPRVAFLGRSNVGKSSLLNALMNRSLAVTSKQPGRTQQVYYYGWTDSSQSKHHHHAAGYLVDLPGYGYAVGPAKAVDEWQRRTQQFLLKSRDALRRVYLLQDARLDPQSFDMNVENWLDEAEIPYTVVLTKADGVSRPAKLIKHVNMVCMRYHANQVHEQPRWQSPFVHITSARKKEGLVELWSSVEMELLHNSE